MSHLISLIIFSGLAVLLDNLNEMEEQELHDESEELYIKCMKSFMNNKVHQCIEKINCYRLVYRQF